MKEFGGTTDGLFTQSVVVNGGVGASTSPHNDTREQEAGRECQHVHVYYEANTITPTVRETLRPWGEELWRQTTLRVGVGGYSSRVCV